MEVAERLGQAITFETCNDEWVELDNDHVKCMEKHKEYRQVSVEYNKLRQESKSLVTRQLKKLDLLKTTLQRFPTTDRKTEILDKIQARKRELEETSRFLPKRNGFYLRLIVGDINMVLDSKSEKFKYKDGYEKFKLACSVTLLIYSTLLSFCLNHRAFDAVFSFMMLWYYCTLTVRESILIANGSRIKGWWVMHHYVSVVLSGINVVWPSGESYWEFRHVFMGFSMYQSFVQLLQYYYQSGCLYRLRALGERHDMDITVEGFSSWMMKGLHFLLPFLFIGQFWELYNSYALMRIAIRHNYDEWQVPCLALCFFVLFFGNFFTTLLVVFQKKKAMDHKKSQ